MSKDSTRIAAALEDIAVSLELIAQSLDQINLRDSVVRAA